MKPDSSDQRQLFVRLADRADLPGLLPLYRDLNPDDVELSVDAAETHLDALGRIPGSAVHVGVLDQTIVSTCTLIVLPNLTRGGQPYALIENVVTGSQHRGRGYGRATLQHAVSAAWDHGCYKVMLLTGSTKTETLGVYRSAGFEQNKTGFQIRRIAPRIG
ncbi:GNAT family N-acetyltransferase [Peteryoungia ipomoeae]|uniref:GNAT family N-acetyltransferase n=1 Tax=Peteryoungia ipomoeae TaxID=1210932 RepID=A0A4S8P4X3_9HYPH|nr:GNAT family N-acetyltransferase [Peteryoungia ipomoeae]THV25167.1 GNAT family N-acetyltransferase [Peteryoungia ipomoeae]